MAELRVTRTGKDGHGDITALCGGWGPRVPKSRAIEEIEKGTHAYYVEEVSPRVYVKVIHGGSGKYLRTEADGQSKNNLDNLPDC